VKVLKASNKKSTIGSACAKPTAPLKVLPPKKGKTQHEHGRLVLRQDVKPCEDRHRQEKTSLMWFSAKHFPNLGKHFSPEVSQKRFMTFDLRPFSVVPIGPAAAGRPNEPLDTQKPRFFLSSEDQHDQHQHLGTKL